MKTEISPLYRKSLQRSTVAISLAALSLAAAAPVAAKDLVVAADGSGDFKTVQEAIAAIPDKNTEIVLVHIKPGVYGGQKVIPRGKDHVHFQGEDAAKTVLTWNINTNEEQPAGTDPHHKGTAMVVGADDFQAKDLTFENASGDHGQALALKIDGDRALVQNCRLLGWQDTVMVNNGRQYFKDCTIEGRVDFIYGSGTAIFDNCEIKSKNGGHVTAANTPQDHPFGLVFLGCRLTADPAPWVDPATGQAPAGRRLDAMADLGRPWRPYACVTYLNCRMGEHIAPTGWNNWGNPENEKTARYAEFNSMTLDGGPLDVSKRFAWAKVLSAKEASLYSTYNILGDWRALGNPTFVLAGDSTVTDDAGWGAGFAHLLKPGITLVNLAKGGRSSRSFRDEGSWQKVLDLKPKYVLIQFGHNDQPGHGPDRETDPNTTYRANIARYVDEARGAGIEPILVTPMTRRQFDANGKINSTLVPYAEAVKSVATEKKVPVIDLHSRSLEFFEKLGPKNWQPLAPAKENGGFDGTHLNAAGSAAIAPLVVAELEKALPALAADFKN